MTPGSWDQESILRMRRRQNDSETSGLQDRCPTPILPRATQGYGQEEMLPQPRELGHRMADCRHQYGAIASLQLFYTDYILAFICI
jgi:hypothetical protein